MYAVSYTESFSRRPGDGSGRGPGRGGARLARSFVIVPQAATDMNSPKCPDNQDNTIQIPDIYKPSLRVSDQFTNALRMSIHPSIHPFVAHRHITTLEVTAEVAASVVILLTILVTYRTHMSKRSCDA